jgi:hypothetical protein
MKDVLVVLVVISNLWLTVDAASSFSKLQITGTVVHSCSVQTTLSIDQPDKNMIDNLSKREALESLFTKSVSCSSTEKNWSIKPFKQSIFQPTLNGPGKENESKIIEVPTSLSF